MSKTPKKCSCQSGQSYVLCCGRYHKGKLHAPTALALMRSRYSAYVIGNAQYLYRSWHVSTRPALQSLRDSCHDESQKFTSLDIIALTKGGVDDETGTVEFIATYDSNGKSEKLHENSKFSRLNGHWVYFEAL